MEWIVRKIGLEMLDALHAYGAAIAVASAFDSLIEVRNEGSVYRLSGLTGRLSEFTVADFLARVLALPVIEQLEGDKKKLPKDDLTLTNFDGLLAASFTTPGVRFVSLLDLVNSRQLLTRGPAALKKVNRLITRLETFVERTSKGSTTWFESALDDYTAESPVLPVIDRKRSSHDLTISLTLDPSVGFSTYRAISDGRVADKTNLTLRCPRLAVLFVIIGATRFLRAQRVGDRSVNLYVPIADSLVIRPGTALPILDSTSVSPTQAVLYQWLSHSITASSGTVWYGLAYQTLQTQMMSQSISISRGCLTYSWLNSFRKRLGLQMLKYWTMLLYHSPEQLSLDTGSLTDMLLNRRSAAWLDHLRALAMSSLRGSVDKIRPYTLKEVREVTRSMNVANNISPLSAILERQEGTLQFGRALRRLGEVSGHTLFEMISHLDSAKTPDQLTRVVALIVQHCRVRSARSQFMIVPDETDFKGLLNDLHEFGPRSLANILVALSFLQYPGTNRYKNELRRKMLTRANRSRIKAQVNRITASRFHRYSHPKSTKRRHNVH